MEKKNLISEATGMLYGEAVSLKPIDTDVVKAVVTARKMELDFHGAVIEGFLDDDGAPCVTIQKKEGLGTIAHIKL